MKNLLLVLCCVSLVGCANARFASNDSQCLRNPAVDGLAVAAMTGVPFYIVATTPIGLGVAAIMGGSYFVAHDAMCNARN